MVKSQVLHPAQLADAPSMALAKTEVTSSPLFTLPKTPASRQRRIDVKSNRYVGVIDILEYMEIYEYVYVYIYIYVYVYIYDRDIMCVYIIFVYIYSGDV